MTRRALRFGVLSIALAVIAVAAVEIGVRQLRTPPVETYQRALRSLSASEAAGADSLAAGVLSDARRHLQAGQQALKNVNDSWWPFGSYSVADSFFRESVRLSELAASSSGERLEGYRDGIKSELAQIRDSLAFWRESLDNMLPRANDEVLYRSAMFELKLALDLVKRDRHDQARLYADTVLSLLGSLDRAHAQRQASEIERAGLWHEWVSRTIEDSRKSGRAAVIVDKSRHRLFVVSAGQVVDSFPCDLGFNSGNQKRRAGDGATPEGVYRVVHANRSSKYHLALLLDYPNKDDRKRFDSDLQSQTIPAGSSIGGLIEIHGHGGTGRDWTDGCVALDDRHMDRLWKIASTGTPVTIVRTWKGRL